MKHLNNPPTAGMQHMMMTMTMNMTDILIHISDLHIIIHDGIRAGNGTIAITRVIGIGGHLGFIQHMCIIHFMVITIIRIIGMGMDIIHRRGGTQIPIIHTTLDQHVFNGQLVEDDLRVLLGQQNQDHLETPI
jgi:hypothetical protein